MAHPIGFKEATDILQRPAGMSADECKSLEVFRDGKYCISRWQFTDEELDELKRNGGKVYLLVMGKAQPPAFVGAMSPFQEGKVV
jgi:hypothetical protein